MKKSYTRWLILLGIAAMIVLLAACSSSSPRGGEDDGTSTLISVLTQDFSFSLDTSQTEAGMITFVVQNNGSIPHDFAIRESGVDHKTPMIDPGESATLTVDLQPGTYTYVCSVPGHEHLGMSGVFTVTSN